MRKVIFSFMIISILAMGLSNIQIGAEGMENDDINEVVLSKRQKKELSKLYKGIFEQKKEVINKYVEYGIFSEEKGEKIISKMDMHYEKLKENDFIPKWDRHHGKNKEED